jgi:hypothetical protein
VCCLAIVLGAVGSTTASPSEVQQYYEAVKDICRTGVTPEMTTAWIRARQALDAMRDASNFAGIKSPTEMWLDCFQSPGDGKE